MPGLDLDCPQEERQRSAVSPSPSVKLRGIEKLRAEG